MRMEKAILVFRKDFLEITRNREVVMPMLILPLIFALVLPAVSFLAIPNNTNPGGNDAAAIGNILSNLPQSVQRVISNYSPLQQTQYVMVVYFFAPFFLIIPIMSSSVIASDSFAGEKERNTIEALLATPLTDSELLFGKILVSFIPGMGVTLLGFILYTATVDILGYQSFGGLILPTVTWLVMIFVLSPIISLLGIAVAVVVSSRVKGFREAQQLSAMLIIPILLLLFGQAAGFIMLGSLVVLGLSAVFAVLALIVFKIGLGVFQRENIISQSK